MEVIIKNFPETVDSKIWGITVFSFGEMKVPKEANYPLQEYAKEDTHFWEKGRVLNQLFLVYISAGSGEARFGNNSTEQIEEGSILILYPGIRHRYRPSAQTGWTETWFGLKGTYIDSLLKKYKIFGSRPIVHLSDRAYFEKLLKSVKAILLAEKIGYQIESAGLVISILSSLFLQGKQEEASTSRMEQIIIEARRKLQNLEATDPFDVKVLAVEFDVSYSWFRKMYKHYTGSSPVQYRILLNIERASTLLMQSHLSVKEIAFKAGFESEAYFCRQFKQKHGMSPTEFRTRN